MKKKKYNVAVVGATGAVGNEPAVLMLFQVNQSPVNSRPCQLK